MFNFGTHPVDLDSFGVAGLLEGRARIFYSPLFGTKHVGRVSDLLCAQLKGTGIDDLRLRTLLVFEIFQAYRGQAVQMEPVNLECGVDSTKLGLSISFILNRELELNVEGFSDRVFNNKGNDLFETMLFQLQDKADRVVLKFQPLSRKMEISVLIGIDGKIDPELIKQKVPPELVVLGKTRSLNSQGDSQVGTKPDTQSNDYVNLGDIDFSALLKEETLKKPIRESATGEFFISGQSEKDFGFATSVSGIALGGEEEIRISGVTQNIQEDIIRVKSSKEDNEESQSVKIKQPLLKMFGRLFSRKKTTEEPSLEATVDVALEPSVIENNPAPVDNYADEFATLEAKLGIDEPDAVGADLESNSETDSEILLNQLVKEIDPTLKNVQKELSEIKQGKNSQNIVKWLEKLIYRLVTERKHLQETARALNRSIKFKETEVKGKLAKMHEELKNRDLQILEKTQVLQLTRDQVTELNEIVETMKERQIENVGDFQARRKLELTQKMLYKLKEENSLYLQKVEELKKKIGQISGVASLTKSKGPTAVEYKALQDRFDLLTLQAEEFKKANRQLMDRLSAPRRDRVMGNAEEMKRRLEGSLKIITARQKENEVLKVRLQNFQSLEVKLRLEMEHLRSELRRSKEGASEPVGGSSAPRAA